MISDQPDLTYRDQLLTCAECGTPWIWILSEQRQLDAAGAALPPPARCPVCQRIAPAPGHQRGLVKWYNPQKGYGFITLPSGDEIFIHRSGLAQDAPPAAGDLVEFAVTRSARGPQAISLTVLRLSSTDRSSKSS